MGARGMRKKEVRLLKIPADEGVCDWCQTQSLVLLPRICFRA